MNINIISVIDAASEGNIESELVLGVLFDIGYFGKNQKKAFEWYKRAADKGSPLAQYILSGMLKAGQGTAINYDEAFRYLQKAVDVKFMPAIVRLAEFYEKGIGVTESTDEKVKILKNAAIAGNIEAAFHLSYHFSDEHNGYLNYQEALKWLFLAESLGTSSACFFIAGIYRDMKDFINAIFYYNKACDLGNEDACLLMAVYYSKGALGLKKDEQKAKQYSERAKEIQKKITSPNEVLFSFTNVCLYDE